MSITLETDIKTIRNKSGRFYYKVALKSPKFNNKMDAENFAKELEKGLKNSDLRVIGGYF